MNLTTKKVLLTVLTNILKLLHPFMPYVTEEIYQMLPIKEESIMISQYPTYDVDMVFLEETNLVDGILHDIVEIRNLKATNNIKKDDLVIIESKYLELFKNQLKIKEEYLIDKAPIDYTEINYKSTNLSISYFIKEVEIDIETLKEEIKELEQSISRRKHLLNNENYVKKAPKNIVDLDRNKLKEELEKLEMLKEKIK